MREKNPKFSTIGLIYRNIFHNIIESINLLSDVDLGYLTDTYGDRNS
jgi:hypothetical protein